MSDHIETAAFEVGLGDLVHIPYEACGEYLIVTEKFMLHMNGDRDGEELDLIGLADTDWWGMHRANECVGSDEPEQKRYEVLYHLEFRT